MPTPISDEWGVTGPTHERWQLWEPATIDTSSDPADAYVRSDALDRRFVSMSEVRKLAASLKAPQRPSAQVDLRKIRFGVEIEMEKFPLDVAHKLISSLPNWRIHPKFRSWQVVKDESLSSGGEAVSPVMTLENGKAAEQIREVFRIFHELGGKATPNCAFQVHVDGSILGEKGLANLMKMSLEQEGLLFRLAQNGHSQHRGTISGAGYRHGTTHFYAKPLSWGLRDPFPVLHADSANEFRNSLYSAIPAGGPRNKTRPPLPPVDSSKDFAPDRQDAVRYFFINFNSYWYRGSIEFRVFDATDDPEQALANLELVLGMVKAAAEDSYEYLRTSPLGNGKTQTVSREAFDYFLSKVANTPQLRDRLTRTFLESGGKIADDALVTDPKILNAVYLLEEGFRFQADGKDIRSPFEIMGEMEGGSRKVTVAGPGLSRPLRLAYSGDLERLAQETQAKFQFSEGDTLRVRNAIQQLQEKGFFFSYAHDGMSAEAGGPYLMRESQVMAALRHEDLLVIPPSAPEEAVLVPSLERLEQYARLECSSAPDLKPEMREIISLTGRLKEAGYELRVRKDVGSAPRIFAPVSRYALFKGIEEKNAFIPLSRDYFGEYHNIESLEDLREVASLVLRKPEEMDDPTRTSLDILAKLEAKGVRWMSVDALGKQDSLTPLGQILKLRQGSLRGTLPHRIFWEKWYRNDVHVTGEEQLQKLARKLGILEEKAESSEVSP